LLLDTSRSALEALEQIQDAALDFIDLLKPADRAMVVSFDHSVNVLCPLTSDRRRLGKTIEEVDIGQRFGTVMRDAVIEVVEQHFTRVKGRKAIILLTDGKDFGSSLSKDELLDRLEESDVMVYSVLYKTRMRGMGRGRWGRRGGWGRGRRGGGFPGDPDRGGRGDRYPDDPDEDDRNDRRGGGYPDDPEESDRNDRRDGGYPDDPYEDDQDGGGRFPGDPDEDDRNGARRGGRFPGGRGGGGRNGGGYGRGRGMDRDADALEYAEKMAEISAGRTYQNEVADLKETFASIADELRKQYRLGFYPPDGAEGGGVHKIRVKVARSDLAVRSRNSYRTR
jgi:von Willebrand factor type A domain